MKTITPDPIEPSRKDFETLEEYDEALGNWFEKMHHLYPGEVILTEREWHLEKERRGRSAMWREIDYYENCGAYGMAEIVRWALLSD